jgi:uncharacterized protein (TIGR03084 family)
VRSASGVRRNGRDADVTVSMDDLARDLESETAVLQRILDGLADEQWTWPTPAPGWSIADQVSHLAHSDEVAVLSATDGAAFEALLARENESVERRTERWAQQHRHRAPSDLIAWFTRARTELIATFRALDPSVRVPWYGPDMSAAAALTARIMETWAHGRDIADTIGAQWAPTPGLRQVAHLCVRALPNSFRARGRSEPDVPVYVALTTPDGEVWEWGPPDAENRVTGDAVELCLVATQRRHPDDTRLVAEGAVAAEWLTIAQAFAGPPGVGRAPSRAS